MSIRRMMLFTLGAKIKNLIQAFKERVLATQGEFEAETCLDGQLTELDNDNLLDSASLIVTPNGYKETLLYSVVPTDASGDMSVTRATLATRVNADGDIEVVPYNLFQQSQNFENAFWTKNRTTIVQDVIIAPDGTLTADNVIADSGVTYLYTGFNGVNILNGTSFPTFLGTRTASVYLKYNGLNRIRFQYGTAGTLLRNIYVEVDLQTGTITGTRFVDGGITYVENAFIEDVGDGWYRVGFNLIVPTSPTNNRLGVALGDTTKTVADGIDGVYVWGFQMVDGTQPKDYFPTTNRFNIPRIDYSNGSCPSILVEPQRTNLVLHSQDFSQTYWSKFNSVVVTGGILSPDGNNNAFNLNFNGTVNGRIEANAGTSGNYNQSVWLKTSTGTASVILGTATSNLQTFIVDDVWRRYNGYFLSGSFPRIRCDQATNIQAWGAQLEAGTNATSYIPTTTATATRNADIISNTNASTLIGQTEGTVLIEFINTIADFADTIFDLTDGTNSNYIRINRLSGNRIQLLVAINNVIVVNIVNVVNANIEPLKKIGVGYINNNISLYVNGVLIGTNTTSNIPSNLSAINLGSRITNANVFNDRINNLVLLKTRLSNAELQNLTTL
jgi:hypothetical protein